MKFSLIMATLGRVAEVELFFKSLIIQNFPDHELIVVDQNEHYLLRDLVEKYKEKLNIIYIRSDKKGLSLNSNIGLSHATGDVIGFPDDDCEYSEGILHTVSEFFLREKNYDIFSCNTVEKGKNVGFTNARTYSSEISRFRAEGTIVSFTLFFRMTPVEFPRFDEQMGVGAYFGSAEERDVVYELFKRGTVGFYFADKYVYHPAKEGESVDPKRVYSYSLGFGAVLKKEVLLRKRWYVIFQFGYNILANLFGYLFKRNKMEHRAALLGRWRGFFEYKVK